MATPGSMGPGASLARSRSVTSSAHHRWSWRYRGGVRLVLILSFLSASSAVPTSVPVVTTTPVSSSSVGVNSPTRQHTTDPPTSETPRQPERVQIFPQTTRPVQIAPPTFRRVADNKTAVQGGRVTFRCQPEGQNISVTWEKDGQPLASSRYFVKTNSNLRISNITAADRGLYRCRAANLGGVSYSPASYLDVQVAARFLTDGQHLNVSYGTVVNLTCPVTGNPKPTVTWSKNRDFIKDWEARSLWAKQFLTINATSSENYTCIARNTVTSQDGSQEEMVLAVHHSVRVYNIPNYCASYRGHVCSGYVSGRNVFVDADLYNPLRLQEPMLGRLAEEVDRMVKTPRCNSAFKSLMCHSMLPDCQNGNPPRAKPLCREDCLVVTTDLCRQEWYDLQASKHEALLRRLRPLLGASQCQGLPSKQDSPGRCSDANLFEMEDSLVTKTCVQDGGHFYQGNISVTETGRQCQPWLDEYPQVMHMFPSVYPELVNGSNHCRNPGGMYREPGCFPVGEKTWQPCSIPSCDAKPKASTTALPKRWTTLTSVRAEEEKTELVTERRPHEPVRMEPSNRQDIYLICGGALAGVCFIFIAVAALVWRRHKSGRYSRYKYPGDFDVSRLPENPMYGKDFNKSFNPHLRHLEYPRNSIIYIVDIGEGAFGRVFKAIAPRLQSGEASTTVAVKMLKCNADRDVQEYFNREAEIIARFDHANVIRLLGVCFVGRPLCLLLEYMGQGDMQEFLHYHAPDKADGPPRLTGRTQLNLAYQVACGMVYLTEKRFVHRDIATRNCLVGNNNEVKISDFGLARYLGSSDHYLGHKDETIPIRWTAPEALWHYKFTTYSDVWSFGVLLWEIFSFAKQPYEDMTHEEVFLQTYKGHRLECPEGTPRCVYELIQMCCSQDINARSSFYMVRDALEALQDSDLVC